MGSSQNNSWTTEDRYLFFFPAETTSEKMFQMVIGNGYGILFNLTPTKPTVVSNQGK